MMPDWLNFFKEVTRPSGWFLSQFFYFRFTSSRDDAPTAFDFSGACCVRCLMVAAVRTINKSSNHSLINGNLHVGVNLLKDYF